MEPEPSHPAGTKHTAEPADNASAAAISSPGKKRHAELGFEWPDCMPTKRVSGVPLKSKGGRPPASIDPDQVEKLAQLGATQSEIARFVGVAFSTLEERLKQSDYREAYKRGLGNLHMSLKRKQVEMALAGDRTMLIWLGKNYLGQSDKLDTKLTGAGPNGEVQLESSARELDARITRIIERRGADGSTPRV